MAELSALYVSYPSAGPMPTTAPAVWWGQLRGLSDRAILSALRRAPREAENPHFMPSAELVRRVAAATEKSLVGPKPDLSLPALPEHEEPPSDPYWRKVWERYKRGKVPRGQQAQVECARIVAGVGGKLSMESAS